VDSSVDMVLVWSNQFDTSTNINPILGSASRKYNSNQCVFELGYMLSRTCKASRRPSRGQVMRKGRADKMLNSHDTELIGQVTAGQPEC
jgi:hypothetical protein